MFSWYRPPMDTINWEDPAASRQVAARAVDRHAVG